MYWLSFLVSRDTWNVQARRLDPDKLLRDSIAKRFEAQFGRVLWLPRDLINQGEIDKIDDLEAAAIKLRTFADRYPPRQASRLFGSVRCRSDQRRWLTRLYQYDAGMLASPMKSPRQSTTWKLPSAATVFPLPSATW